MIYDSKNSNLYADDGSFIKKIHCPLALHPDQLESIDNLKRFCCSCNKSINCIDALTEEDVRSLVIKNIDTCIFATSHAKNIKILQPFGYNSKNEENLQTIQTLRTLEGMAAAQKNGFNLIIKDVGKPHSYGDEKFLLYQNLKTGELWWTGDFRSSIPERAIQDNPPDMREYMNENWKKLKDWFFVKTDCPFPIAAYAIPKDAEPGGKFFLPDVIEDIRYTFWNQGNANPVLSASATWNGEEFLIDHPNSYEFVG